VTSCMKEKLLNKSVCYTKIFKSNTSNNEPYRTVRADMTVRLLCPWPTPDLPLMAPRYPYCNILYCTVRVFVDMMKYSTFFGAVIIMIRLLVFEYSHCFLSYLLLLLPILTFFLQNLSQLSY
jgi:hypothetical protein